MESTKLPRGPTGLKLFQYLRLRRKDPLKYYESLTREFGSVVRLKIGKTTYCLVNDDESIAHVLQTNARNYVKGPGYEMLRMIVGEGLLTSEGEHWRKQRRMAQPTFHRDNIIRFTDVFQTLAKEQTDVFVRSIGDSSAKVIDLSAAMNGLTVRVACQTLFGIDGNWNNVANATNTALKEIDRQTYSILRLLDFFIRPGLAAEIGKRFGFDSQEKIRQSKQKLDQAVLAIIENRRRDKDLATRSDLLSLLMNSRDEQTGQAMSDKELLDEVMSLFLAGHETTASALTWCLFLLAKDPSLQEELHKEAHQSLRQAADTAGSAYDILMALPRTRAFFDETLRLYPPFWRITRRALADDTIHGFRIPAGSSIMISPYLIHRNEKYWNEPEKFDPKRFLDPNLSKTHRFSYIPFGAGPRSCIGNVFATYEAQIILCYLLSALRFTTCNATDATLDPHITLRFKNGMNLLVSKR